jgi:probable phosphoglycerate mutase
VALSRPSGVRLFLVRHGLTAANREWRLIGRRDDPLAAEGERQAEALAAALAGLEPAALVTSPSARATATARPIGRALGLVARPEPRLAEMDFGTWEGKTGAEVGAGGEAAQRHLERWRADPELAPPGGESLAALRTRVRQVADELAAEGEGPVVAVTHMGPIKTLLLDALGLPLTAAWRVVLDPGTLTVIDWSERPRVRVVNAPAFASTSAPAPGGTGPGDAAAWAGGRWPEW